MKIIKLIAIMLIASFAANAQMTGREIVDKAYNRPAGDDQTSILTMTLTNKSGQTRIRKIKQYTKTIGDVDKSIMFFMSPADVRNTSFMNWSYTGDKSDDQWIYLPALKKTKRISSDSKSDYFMGSDFTYDDLGDRKLDADVHKFLKEESIDGHNCYVVESISKDEDYIYSKTVTWIRKDNYVGVKKDFYDEDSELLKTLFIKEVKEISGYWVVTHSEMKSVQKNHTTTIQLSDIKVNTGVPSSKFSERMMTRGI